MRLRSFLLFSCLALVACAGILGLEEPTFFGGDAGSETGSGDAPSDGASSADAPPVCVPHETEQLAKGYGLVYDLAIDSDAVYFTSFDRWLLVRITKDGTNMNELLPEGGVQEPTGLRVQGAHVYWTAYGAGNFADYRNGVRRIPKVGGKPESYEVCNTAFDLAVDEKHVYAVSSVCGDVVRVRRYVKDEPAAKGFVESYRDGTMSMEFGYATFGWTGEDSDSIYWASAKSIRKLAKSYGPDAAPTIIGDAPESVFEALTVDDRVYALTQNVLYAFDKNGAAKPVILVEGLSATGARAAIALDEKYVYFTEPKGGFVSRVPRAGTAKPETLAMDQALPSGIAVDACSIYWTNAGDGSVWRMPKPK